MSDNFRRVVDGEADGVAESLRPFVEAAEARRGRLSPGAVARVEAAIAELDGGAARIWRVLRAPVYAIALVGAGVVGVRMSPRAPLPVVETRAAAPAPSTESLHLDEGTLAVVSDTDAVLVNTPDAKVEVAPHSRVRISIEDRAVRIVADAGAARVLYFDGRIELVEPAQVRTAPTSIEPPPAVHRHLAKKTRALPSVPPSPLPSTSVRPAPADDGERASLSAAIGEMREAPDEALRLLEAHLGRYPDGALRLEAEAGRVAILLRLGRRTEALSTLEHVRAPSPELLILRGELRAEAHRCDEALGDFGAVLASGDDLFTERALVGRAMCRGELGRR